MSTNYYWHRFTPCPTCNHNALLPLHIGKSSGGWYFSLHVYPDDGINTLDDWKRRWNEPGSSIKDEYGDPLTREEMAAVIETRRWPHDRDWSSAELRANYAERGERNMARHIVDGTHCIGHGPGTWDYIVGDFS